MHRPQQADKKTRSAHDRIEEMAAIKAKLLIAGITLTKVDEEYKRASVTDGWQAITIDLAKALGSR
ncbi:hypothetical protein [Rhizobium ruizarguesonis]|uniref:hypothetical protein n=1 Tax=Rhizobium ruizarguesonis TaxID=2081791 RepID=UPI001032675E|nr:hypothetical protein [Rhizobium ruizarguesonis]TBE20538.1 hypothetical protein ELH05_28205 [Rhizobium ruizarguesonis]TCA27790.1 hypothetical protein E0H66_31815 [Rhizobium leguminosarum bv. viciae]WSH23709.1 hypothetical protein U8Q07_25705 [Rhizobium ruizarguesonis]WSH37105.1 hypothetical protein U8P70_28550 [Rhizobium ruizarguesonis]